MFAVQINHPRFEERSAQISLASAIGARVYHEGARTFVVTQDGAHCRKESLIPILHIPTGWEEGPADPIGGWQE